MGDLWVENILISTDDKRIPTLYVLDWELARTGLPGVEVGLFCSYMDLLGRESGCSTYSDATDTILRSFIDSYGRVACKSERLAGDTLAHWGISHIFWGPRDPPGGKELTQRLVMDGVEFLARSKDGPFVRKSAVTGLMPA